MRTSSFPRLRSHRVLAFRCALLPLSDLLGLCYMCVSVIRNGLGDWAVKFLAEVRHPELKVSTPAHTKHLGWYIEFEFRVTQEWGMTDPASCIMLLEAGGFAGSLAAGVLSDTVFAGRRAPVIGGLGAAIVLPLTMLSWAPTEPSTATLIPQLAFLLFGVCSFAPHVLIGLAAREWSAARCPLSVLRRNAIGIGRSDSWCVRWWWRRRQGAPAGRLYVRWPSQVFGSARRCGGRRPLWQVH